MHLAISTRTLLSLETKGPTAPSLKTLTLEINPSVIPTFRVFDNHFDFIPFIKVFGGCALCHCHITSRHLQSSDLRLYKQHRERRCGGLVL
jgi:hypothetical protein